MAKTGGWAKKLTDKSRANATKLKLGGQRATITRTKATHHEKRVAFEAHRRLVVDHAINLGCRVTDLSKSGKKRGVTFRGDGLPDDSHSALRTPPTNAERAEADDRKPIKSECFDGWKPARFKRQPDSVTLMLRNLAK
jgi:hypothetical protein